MAVRSARRQASTELPGRAGAPRRAGQARPAQDIPLNVDFRAYAAQPDRELDLLEGALLIARDARPALDSLAVSAELDGLAAPLVERGLQSMPVLAQARAFADLLFVRGGFRGNTTDYYDPKNSFIDEVLARRTGIPISLSVLYVEVARRAGVPAQPVGFPGHFLVRLDDSERCLVVDPFHGGGIIDEAGLAQILRRSGSDLQFEPGMLAPTPVRHVVARMLMNLRGIYASRGEFSRLLVVFDHLIDLMPGATEERRDRGLLFGRLGAPEAAVADLKRYLALSPEAGDADEIKGFLARFESELGRRCS